MQEFIDSLPACITTELIESTDPTNPTGLLIKAALELNYFFPRALLEKYEQAAYAGYVGKNIFANFRKKLNELELEFYSKHTGLRRTSGDQIGKAFEPEHIPCFIE